jgi:formylmethanofuran dehydrogenase subunit E
MYNSINVRAEIQNLIASNNLNVLLEKSAQMHGHYCPGLAMGVMAATYAMNTMEAESHGMEDLLAITETNNCFSDGVQFVTGCTFGNNALIFKDFGKTAFTLSKRDGKGIRVSSKPESQQVIREAFPEFHNLYKKVVEDQDHSAKMVTAYRKASLDRAFGTLTLDFSKLFDVHNVIVEIPGYAKIHDSVICSVCKESVMKTRALSKVEGDYKCLSCGGSEFNMLDGNGIHIIKP